MDVRYQLPARLPPHHLLIGDIHCHGDVGAYASATDQVDELHRDRVVLEVELGELRAADAFEVDPLPLLADPLRGVVENVLGPLHHVLAAGDRL